MALMAKKVDPTFIQKELSKFDAEWPDLKAYWSARMTKAWAHKSYDDYILKESYALFFARRAFMFSNL